MKSASVKAVSSLTRTRKLLKQIRSTFISYRTPSPQTAPTCCEGPSKQRYLVKYSLRAFSPWINDLMSNLRNILTTHLMPIDCCNCPVSHEYIISQVQPLRNDPFKGKKRWKIACFTWHETAGLSSPDINVLKCPSFVFVFFFGLCFFFPFCSSKLSKQAWESCERYRDPLAI